MPDLRLQRYVSVQSAAGRHLFAIPSAAAAFYCASGLAERLNARTVVLTEQPQRAHGHSNSLMVEGRTPMHGKLNEFMAFDRW